MTLYIKYLNKAKGFKEDVVEFKGQDYTEAKEKAVKWAKENLEKFDLDMIRIK